MFGRQSRLAINLVMVGYLEYNTVMIPKVVHYTGFLTLKMVISGYLE